ncbi:MAG: type VI secretion system baseplate subunit TssK [Polyangiaceae bacterium]|nr:type VI secretion system baseplate subunit TssK [Polyangiaceae bacterium]
MKPYWPRTLLLQPVHLQARDTYIEDMLTRRLETLMPHDYGVIATEIDDKALEEGQLIVRALEAILPSGLGIEVSPEAPLVRDISTALGTTTPSIDVFVGVPKLVLRGLNVSPDDGMARSVRYTAKSDGDMPWLLPKVALLLASEVSDPWECLRIGRLERTGGPLRMERSFSRTPLRVQAADGLQAGIKQLLNAVEERRSELVTARKDFPLNFMSASLEHLPHVQLLVALHRFFPLLKELSVRRTAHPYELYEVLATLYGTLRVFDSNAEEPPAYAHETPGTVFPWLFEHLVTLVREAARDDTTMLPFEKVDEVSFRLTFPRTFLVGKRPYLVASGADEAYLCGKLPGLLKMASPTVLPQFVNTATQGVAVAVEFEPPAVLPRRNNQAAYRINVRDPLWLDIEDRLQVALRIEGAPSTLRFSLYSVTRTV